MARVRSPNYPALSLSNAIERVRGLQKVEGRNAVSREAMVKHLGFTSLNGASATVLSGLGKYGLIENVGDGEAKVSDLAMRILYPEDAAERNAALMEAAFRPALFNELRDKWPDRRPSDESLRSYLVRRGFSQGALDQVIQFYRETLDMVGGGAEGHGSPSESPKETAVQLTSAASAAAPTALPAPTVVLGNKPFTVAFDGSTLTGLIAIRRVSDIDRLMKVLAAQKAAFLAMAEDGSDEEDAADPVEPVV